LVDEAEEDEDWWAFEGFNVVSASSAETLLWDADDDRQLVEAINRIHAHP